MASPIDIQDEQINGFNQAINNFRKKKMVTRPVSHPETTISPPNEFKTSLLAKELGKLGGVNNTSELKQTLEAKLQADYQSWMNGKPFSAQAWESNFEDPAVKAAMDKAKANLELDDQKKIDSIVDSVRTDVIKQEMESVSRSLANQKMPPLSVQKIIEHWGESYGQKLWIPVPGYKAADPNNPALEEQNPFVIHGGATNLEDGYFQRPGSSYVLKFEKDGGIKAFLHAEPESDAILTLKVAANVVAMSTKIIFSPILVPALILNAMVRAATGVNVLPMQFVPVNGDHFAERHTFADNVRERLEATHWRNLSQGVADKPVTFGFPNLSVNDFTKFHADNMMTAIQQAEKLLAERKTTGKGMAPDLIFDQHSLDILMETQTIGPKRKAEIIGALAAFRKKHDAYSKEQKSVDNGLHAYAPIDLSKPMAGDDDDLKKPTAPDMGGLEASDSSVNSDEDELDAGVDNDASTDNENDEDAGLDERTSSMPDADSSKDAKPFDDIELGGDFAKYDEPEDANELDGVANLYQQDEPAPDLAAASNDIELGGDFAKYDEPEDDNKLEDVASEMSAEDEADLQEIEAEFDIQAQENDSAAAEIAASIDAKIAAGASITEERQQRNAEQAEGPDLAGLKDMFPEGKSKVTLQALNTKGSVSREDGPAIKTDVQADVKAHHKVTREAEPEIPVTPTANADQKSTIQNEALAATVQENVQPANDDMDDDLDNPDIVQLEAVEPVANAPVNEQDSDATKVIDLDADDDLDREDAVEMEAVEQNEVASPGSKLEAWLEQTATPESPKEDGRSILEVHAEQEKKQDQLFEKGSGKSHADDDLKIEDLDNENESSHSNVPRPGNH